MTQIRKESEREQKLEYVSKSLDRDYLALPPVKWRSVLMQSQTLDKVLYLAIEMQDTL